MSRDTYNKFFQNYFSEICLIISLGNPLIGCFCVIIEDLCILCGCLCSLSTHAFNHALTCLSVKWWWMKLKLSIVADSLLYRIVSVFMMPEKMWWGWFEEKLGYIVLMVWCLVDQVVDYMVSDGEMVEWQGEIQVMSGMVIWCESDRYLWWEWGVEVRNNVR